MRALRRLPGFIAALTITGATLGFGPAPVLAQAYDGTFTVPNQVGGVMTLRLAQQGVAVSGTLSSNGVNYDVQGRVEDGTLTGTMRGADGILHFEAERWEEELWLELYGSDASGQPNYDDYTEIDLVLADASSSGAARQGAGFGGAGNPLAGGATDPYIGTFSDGNVTLQLQGGSGSYRGQVSVDGASYPVQAQGGTDGIQGVIQAPDGQYAIVAQPRGDGLAVASGGMQYALRRVQGTAQGGVASGGAGGSAVSGTAPGGAAAGGSGRAAGPAGQTGTGRPLAPGFTEDHPQVREWVSFLAGKKLTRMSSYSSGSAGGYSARTDVYLCSDRSYAVRDESSVSVDVGGAFGNSGGVGGDQGQWYVITNGQVVGLVLESRTGEVSEFRMDYQNQETYANGERVYVTPAEVCM